MEKVAYLGPDGSYSSLAARKLCPEFLPVPYSSFRLAMNAVTGGECAFAALPIENSLNGAVLVNIDLLHIYCADLMVVVAGVVERTLAEIIAVGIDGDLVFTIC